MAQTESHDVIIIGAGAAGLLCAAIAAQRGRRVLVVDHAKQAGKKFLFPVGDAATSPIYTLALKTICPTIRTSVNRR